MLLKSTGTVCIKPFLIKDVTQVISFSFILMLEFCNHKIHFICSSALDYLISDYGTLNVPTIDCDIAINGVFM